ncbi:hypothetical protein [Tenacibaculum sp. M341]|uniref:hypothetical protein n=1 Tax=Tenacibaculum sp. M341 TaxID=2530339 RepID=UPI00140534D5|nr:hypothetical protein [Tenacibaculum sp. M341]
MRLIKNRRFTVRKVTRKFAYLPIMYRGSLFWLSKVKIEKAFNGMSMRVISIQRA